MSKEDNDWLRNHVVVKGSQVSIEFGDQCCTDHWVNDVLVLTFKRYQQATKFNISYHFTAFHSTTEFKVEWNPATGKSNGLHSANGRYGKLTKPLSIEQMREIVAGRLTFEQVENPSFKPVKPYEESTPD